MRLDVQCDLNAGNKAGEKTSVTFYFAGHGMQKNYTYAVLNTSEGKSLYPLENMIRNLAAFPNCFIWGLFDCCREEFDAESFAQAMRAGMGNDPYNEDDIANKRGNWMVTFACPPSRFTPAASTFVAELFAYMKHMANPEDGSVILPSALAKFWGKSGKFESTSKAV